MDRCPSTEQTEEGLGVVAELQQSKLLSSREAVAELLSRSCNRGRVVGGCGRQHRVL